MTARPVAHPVPGSEESDGRPGTDRARATRISLGSAFAAESGNYFLLLGTVLFLVSFGLVMVLSASTIDSFNDNQGFFGAFLRQALYVFIGVPLMLVVSRMSPQFWKRWAWVLIVGASVLQLLVFSPLGYSVGENRGWIRIGGFTAQPAEAVKVALVVWLAYILSRKRHLLNSWPHVIIPAGPVAGGAILLVMLGQDLGTVLIMAAIVIGAMFFAGVPLRILGTLIALGALGSVVMTMTSASRSSRVMNFIQGTCDYASDCWQPTHGMYALAAGGVFGVGLGNSKAKWSWLPAADNDYIFAIIGEELGMIGAIVVLLLFVVMAVAFIRIIRSTTDSFSRILTGAVMVWIIAQAFVNIAVVLRLLPVLGVPLPLMSSGGSALITTLVALGMVLGIARKPPTGELPDVTPIGAGLAR
ncbi:putative lipid II flippase FtsW [Planctomonas psychrotolerans]|uniref:putative lipid II flippase FtsW n=1 Tax=Planctomonas psychrotolerans TaxID=2528712 RepID=UPI001D0D56D6|nr:putative lipid II flippase FtsW [Planctomonas psychrotolerans]